ncbi:probable G-protein coupled receptor 149 [Acipenser ruthenus]|uniref:probable G-protein coupled receptor 149 n=1 Tax=Acipenser ruthenus TaxID=7906 RepID=UPI002741B13E|nr:probable G-protein coupled receptor 149 [Acipenser ruthenus]
MSATPSPLSFNKTSLFTETYERMDSQNGQRQGNPALFCLSLSITILTFAGSVYSLLSLLKMRSKTSLSLIVASLSVDDLISVIPLSLFLFLQWGSKDQPSALCTSSALLYLFQGVSSNLKASLIVSYTFYITKRFGAFQAAKRPLKIIWAIVGIWIVSVIVSILPLCGWGTFAPTHWGCFTTSPSSYVIFLFVLYALCFCKVVVFSIPLTNQLLCSGDQQKGLNPSYSEIERGPDADVPTPVSNMSSLPQGDPLEKSFISCAERNQDSEPVLVKNKVDTYYCSSPTASHYQTDVENSRNSPVFLAQKRFSLILAMVRIILWMPMMIQILVSHVLQFKSQSLETLSFVLTLLSAAVTPVFVLSERWIHLPCGCFINCSRNAYEVSSDTARVKKKGFEFSLSFHQGYRIYKIGQANHCSGEKSVSYHNFMNYDTKGKKTDPIESNPSSRANLEFRTITLRDSSLQTELNKAFKSESKPCSATGSNAFYSSAAGTPINENNLDGLPVFDGPERRLSHEECRKLELTDWEWCRSKSERTPRQRSSGGLAIPLCAFQGTVSLHAPTGKTLSLSTYEVSSDGQTITPTNKKIEVYRSKSVGHEPNTDDSPNSIADTNVKIHLEVLEICDNEEAMDTVSIVSNISQSSTHARSPSLRYSRRENRFVSCDLGETASYSLFIPTNNPDSDINISIPDTVEAHRQNSKKQHREKPGYQEEIQVLNEVYRKQEEDTGK